MRRIYTITLLLIVAGILFSCSSTSSVYLKEDIKKHSLDSSFALIPMKNEWVPDAVIAPLTGSSKEYLYIALESAFRTSTKNNIEVINKEIEFPEGSFKRTSLSNETMSIDISLPPESLLNSFPERYVYFFEGYGFRIAERTLTGSSYAGNEASTYPVLLFQTEFYLLDKETNEIISWGVVADEAEIVESPQYSHYLEVVSKVSKRILENSPFSVTKPS
jgi:hypothetical protein